MSDRLLALFGALDDHQKEVTSAWFGIGDSKEEPKPKSVRPPAAPPAPQYVKRPRASFEFTSRSILLDDVNKDAAEAELVLDWQKTKDPAKLESLFALNKSWLDSASQSYNSRRIPRPAVKGMIYNSFIETVKKWDPERGANLKTFWGRFQGPNVDKDITQMSQFGKAAKTRVTKVERMRQLAESFELENRREASDSELSAFSDGEFTVEAIKLINKEAKGDRLGSLVLDADMSQDTERGIQMATRRARDYHNSRDQRILNHMFGLDKAEHITSNRSLGKKFGVSEQRISNLKSQFASNIQQEMQLLGI